MDGVITLSAVELERLLITLESAQQVHRRHQFFLWTQGALQGFLPHDLLVFGHGAYGAPGFRSEVLARANTLEDLVLQGELRRLVDLIVDRWLEGGHQPLTIAARADGEGCPAGQLLARLGLGHALAHGTREFFGDCSGFFIFLRMPEMPGRRHSYFVDMLMPYLHTVLHRMLAEEKLSQECAPRVVLRLSARESQVIALVRDGKTNQQIAQVLELSPLTVKNHVQNILRKLEVANRTQAVAKAVKARLIGGPGSA
ncbi:MAG: helix-turn-helix transcriptional regulator [Dechloromonas sp.]|nr:MAG: helix-turn-helix transcriptional regulator [Dechloromonas sp.]